MSPKYSWRQSLAFSYLLSPLEAELPDYAGNLLQHKVYFYASPCSVCVQKWSKNSWKQLISHNFKERGRKATGKDWKHPKKFAYLFSGKTSLNNLNLNKVTVERDLPSQLLCFLFPNTEVTATTEPPQWFYYLWWDWGDCIQFQPSNWVYSKDWFFFFLFSFLKHTGFGWGVQSTYVSRARLWANLQ